MSSDPRRPHLTISRRTVLAGGAATVLLVACGGGSDDDSSGSGGDGSGSSDTSGAQPQASLVPFFGGDVVQAGLAQRITFGIGDADGALVSDGPKSLDFSIRQDGKEVLQAPSAMHAEGLPRGYYPVEITVPRSGSYNAVTSVDGEEVEAAFVVVDDVSVPQVGDPLPVFDTPTGDDPQGVDPVCTREPACPFHAVGLRSALSARQPVVLLVGTPAYCQVGICGPVLDILMEEKSAAPGATFIHAEVYKSGTQAAEGIENAALTPAVERVGLTFEPCLFVVGSDGKVKVRLDNIYDRNELRRALAKAV